jgi:hypothetical protein
MPMTIGRGMCCLPAKRQIAQRYKNSGKKRLVLIVVSDLDPAGEAIADDLLKSMRDFSVEDMEAYKAALTPEQVARFKLAPSMDAKPTSPTYREFVKRHGPHAYELEALAPPQLIDLFTAGIECLIDSKAFPGVRN